VYVCEAGRLGSVFSWAKRVTLKMVSAVDDLLQHGAHVEIWKRLISPENLI